MKLANRINGSPCLFMVYIPHAISSVNWDDVFSNQTVDEKVKSLNNIIPNIFSIYMYIKLSNPTKVSQLDES